jgi:hypothetical protein
VETVQYLCWLLPAGGNRCRCIGLESLVIVGKKTCLKGVVQRHDGFEEDKGQG